MAYTITLGNKMYKTLNEEYSVTEERQQTGNTIKIRFNIVATGANQEKTTDWINMPLSDPIGVIKKTMPSIVDNLPLVELNEKNRSYVCSARLIDIRLSDNDYTANHLRYAYCANQLD